MIQIKQCSKCNKIKPLDEFKLLKNNIISRKCLDCKNNYTSKDFVRIKVPKKLYLSIHGKALRSGFSISKYIQYIHEKEMKKKK